MGALSSAIAGNAALASLRSFIVLVCSTGVSILVSRALGPEDFGEYRLALGLIWSLEVVSVLGFPTAITKFVAERASHDGAGALRIVGFFLRIAVAIYLVGAATLLIFHGAI